MTPPKLKIITVVGARPQFVKCAVVSRAFEESQRIEEILVHTGQHYDNSMSRVFFEELGLSEPKYSLNVGSAPHGLQTGKMMSLLEPILGSEKPDLVVVYGDTNSTLAAALTAAKMGLPIAHIESGLRSFNRRMPEEVNRVLTDHLSDILFAPTDVAVTNLRKEGISEDHIVRTGDIMFDAMGFATRQVSEEARFSYLSSFGLREKSYALVTIHRAENTDDLVVLKRVSGAVRMFSKEIPVLWPLHPRTRGRLDSLGFFKNLPPSLVTTGPLGYLAMVSLERSSALIATDSGGVQKEAYFHRVPCVTLRSETEWVELLDSGWNTLALMDSEASIALSMQRALGTVGKDVNLYGDGHSSEMISQYIQKWFSKRSLQGNEYEKKSSSFDFSPPA